MEKVSDKLKKTFGDTTAVFAIIHEDGAPEASIVVDGVDDVFVDALLNVVVSKNVDHASVSKYVWSILKQATANIVAYSPSHAQDWMEVLKSVQQQISYTKSNPSKLPN